MNGMIAKPQAALRCLGLFLLVTLPLFVVCFFGTGIDCAWADEAERPSVLLIDAGQGDYDTFSLFWLGNQDIEPIAEENGNRLVTAEAPSWWSGDANAAPPAPSTFLLGKTEADGSTTADDIVWAIDKIRESGAQPKVFAVAMGCTGLPLREYAEDLAGSSQSARADLVGMVFCGTPHNGYSVMDLYPDLSAWGTLAQTIGHSKEDLAPGSAYLSDLNAGSFPRPTKTLNIVGTIGDLGFGFTDGIALPADYALDQSLSSQIQSADVTCALGTGINLAGQWDVYTDRLNHPDQLVDKNLVERLPALEGYPTSAEVQETVRDFYNEWFSNGSPVTHISNVVALDLSGSMFEDITPGNDKMSSAKNAAKEYLRAVQAYGTLPQAAPVSVSIIGFSTDLVDVSTGYDDEARNKVEALSALPNETNIGIALSDALEKLGNTPTVSDKRILLLSDGATTEGLSNEEMLAGPVSQAAEKGIVIDAIGFGDVGESNAGFLEQVAAATGGTYYQAQDTYELEVSFIRSYYDSLGLEVVDQELPGSADPIAIGEATANTTAFSVGLIGNGFAPQATLLCNGTEVDPAEYEIQQEGNFVAIQFSDPPLGEYSVSAAGGSGGSHLFSVQQEGLRNKVAVVGEQADSSMLMLIGVGAVFLIALIAVVARTLTKGKQQEG